MTPITRDSPEWQIAEALADPQEAFVLWAVHRGVCTRTSDFDSQYGSGVPYHRLIRSLVSRGLIRSDGDRLKLEPAGIQAMTQLEVSSGPLSEGASNTTDSAKQIMRKGVRMTKAAVSPTKAAARPTVAAIGMEGALPMGALTDILVSRLTAIVLLLENDKLKGLPPRNADSIAQQLALPSEQVGLLLALLVGDPNWGITIRETTPPTYQHG